MLPPSGRSAEQHVTFPHFRLQRVTWPKQANMASDMSSICRYGRHFQSFSIHIKWKTEALVCTHVQYLERPSGGLQQWVSAAVEWAVSEARQSWRRWKTIDMYVCLHCHSIQSNLILKSYICACNYIIMILHCLICISPLFFLFCLQTFLRVRANRQTRLNGRYT